MREFTPHIPFMRRCLELAERGRGKMGNGAMVGAVLVREGEVIAEGWHDKFGSSHAERVLFEGLKSDLKIRSNDVLYVNLEPCCHQGKTPPCTDMIIERGIRTVVHGMMDPDSRVAGKGIRALREAGIRVIGPVIPEECGRLNRGFVSVRTKGRPWITLKMAMTVAGEIANPDCSPMRITSSAQDTWSHSYLRSRHDAILVGIGTILRDNPQLNNRLAQNKAHLYRLILDPHFRIPESSKVVNADLALGTIIITSPAATDSKKRDALQSRGESVFDVPIDKDGRFDWKALWQMLTTPSDDYHGITSILVEGGPRTWEAFRQAGVVDEEVVLVGL